MNSFILISHDFDKRNSYLQTFYKEHHISPFDQTTIAEEGSIGIELMRKLQETIFLRPYQGNAKSIVIENAQNLTIEAQNALLKLLEEPPVFLFIFLSAITEETFLPTILSRCTLIKLTQEKESMDNTQRDSLLPQIPILTSGSAGEKLALAESIAADKEHIKNWFGKIMEVLREKMLHNREDMTQPAEYALLLLALQEAYKTLSTTNVNARALLEHTFLNL